MRELEKAELNKIKIEKLAQKIDQMSISEYNQYMINLIADIRILGAKAMDLKNKQNYIANKPKTRDISVKTDNTIVISASCAGCFAGIFASLLMAGSDNVYGLPIAIFSGLGGFLAGMFGGCFGTWSYENKPLIKALNSIRLKTIAKKLERINYKTKNKKYLESLIKRADKLDEQLEKEMCAKMMDVNVSPEDAKKIVTEMYELYWKQHYFEKTSNIKIVKAKDVALSREKGRE